MWFAGLHITSRDLTMLKVFSDSTRDPRRHTASVLLSACVSDAAGLAAGDDAEQITVQPLDSIPALQLAFKDHRDMLNYYLNHGPATEC